MTAGAISPTTGRRYGAARVCRVWGVARSSFYAARSAGAEARPRRTPGRRGPKPAISDADLLAAIRRARPGRAKGTARCGRACASRAACASRMCDNFFDIRAFGAVLSTGINAGQVRGPVQFAFARSVEPVLPLEVSMTRMAVTNEAEKKELAEGEDDQQKRGDRRTMGRKHIVPYGLYRAEGFVSAKLAERTGFSDADLELLLEALSSMFEHDRSAARGKMASRKLIVFRHASALGNAQAQALFDRVRVGRRVDGEVRGVADRRLDNQPPARAFSDYAVEIDRVGLPDGVEILKPLGATGIRATWRRTRSRFRRCSTPSTACGKRR